MYRFRDTLPIDISEQTISGDLVTIENPEEMGVVDSLEVSLSPIQNLNGYDHPWVGGAGKNKLPNTATSKTASGITFTVNNDGSVKVNGTSTANASLACITGWKPASGTYVVSKGASVTHPTLYLDGTRDGHFVRTLVSENTGRGATVNIDYSDYDAITAGIYVGNGRTIDNVTIYPMVRLSSASDATYEPYENICPISGRTSVETTRTGKNLLENTATTQTVNGITFTKNDDGTITANGTSTNNIFFTIGTIRKAGTYILSGCPQGGSNAGYSIRNYSSSIRDYGNGVTFTVAEGSSENIRIVFGGGGGVAVNNLTFKPMIRLASETDASYEPYQGDTYTTALGRTVYGGTLDVVSGVLTVDRASYTFTSANRQGAVYDSYYAYQTGLIETLGADRGDYVSAICTHYECARTGAERANGRFYMLGGQVLFVDDRFTSVAEANSIMAEERPTVVYPLATPQTYQLTPQQVELLLGENHLWSDGEISVVWHKDLTKGRILPTEAVSINGQYIENVLDGYRTLYTKGRESLGAELNTYSVGTADGEKFKNKRYPARTITVGFQLIADNAEDFREKFNNLNNLLSLDEADFIFHDEEDKFFSGYPIMNAEVEAGENSVKGEWKIYCAYPFKRSVDPITLTMADATVTNTTATFTIDYKGSQPARPVLRAKFAGAKSGGTSSEDGDCGFVAFMDARENIIQLGNPDVLDLDAYAKAGNLINYEFINTSGWTMTGGHRYKGTVTGTVATSDAVDAFWDGGAGQTQSYAKPSYGSGTGLHGSILWKNTAGASNFTLSAVHRLCVNNSNEVGVFELGAYNHSTGKMTAGFVIDKSGNGTTGTVRYIVNAKQVGTDQIDLSYYNTHFGYCNRTPVYVTQKYKKKTWVKVKVKVRRNKYKTKSKVKWVTKTRKVLKKYNYTQSNLNSSIKKDGINVYFQVGNLPRRTFNVPEIEQIVSHDASCYMGTYGTEMNTNMIHSMMFRKETGAVFAEQPNVFTAGDIVEADCNEATVNIYRAGSIGGHLEPQYGALGNDWESFKLTSGENIIRATWSDWVNPTYKPQIEIEYNEVFI